MFPAVKKHLLSFGIERLEQTGKTHIVNGEKVKARKKTSNKWFETQDSISYWEDFNLPKIVWGEISDRSKFAYEENGIFIPEATTFLMVGKGLAYLLCVLNSPLSEWFFSKIGTTTGVGTVRWKKFTIQELLIPNIGIQMFQQFDYLVRKYTKKEMNNYIIQSGLPKEVLEDIYTKDEIKKELDKYIKALYQGRAEKINTKNIEEKLSKNIDNYFNENNIRITEK